MRRIIDFEREEKFHPELLEKITEALEFERRYIDQLIQQDKEEQNREFEEWVNVPIKWHLIVRFMHAVYGEREIPGIIKAEDEAIYYAKSYAREKKLMLWLALSRKKNIQIGADGEVIARYEITQDFINLS